MSAIQLWFTLLKVEENTDEQAKIIKSCSSYEKKKEKVEKENRITSKQSLAHFICHYQLFLRVSFDCTL